LLKPIRKASSLRIEDCKKTKKTYIKNRSNYKKDLRHQNIKQDLDKIIKLLIKSYCKKMICNIILEILNWTMMQIKC